MEMKYYRLVIQYNLIETLLFFIVYFFTFNLFADNTLLNKGKILSGYNFAEPSTQNMQDDDFINPGILWVEQGISLWNK